MRNLNSDVHQVDTENLQTNRLTARRFKDLTYNTLPMYMSREISDSSSALLEKALLLFFVIDARFCSALFALLGNVPFILLLHASILFAYEAQEERSRFYDKSHQTQKRN